MPRQTTDMQVFSQILPQNPETYTRLKIYTNYINVPQKKRRLQNKRCERFIFRKIGEKRHFSDH